MVGMNTLPVATMSVYQVHHRAGEQEQEGEPQTQDMPPMLTLP